MSVSEVYLSGALPAPAVLVCPSKPALRGVGQQGIVSGSLLSPSSYSVAQL